MHTLLVLYADKDKNYFDELQKHLSSLVREKVINLYWKHDITAGKETETIMQSYLQQADMVLLLVSSDFIDLNKEYNYTQQALQKGKTIVPIIVRTCVWTDTVWGQINALPPNNKAVSEYTNQDQAFYDIAIGLRKIIDTTHVPIVQPEHKPQTNEATTVYDQTAEKIVYDQTAEKIYNIQHIDKADFS
jgi:hypothetical protein